jgi:uncharacterized membrane protein
MRTASTVLLYLLSFGVAAYALLVYALLPFGSTVDPQMRADFAAHTQAVYVHAFAASAALLIGPLQFSSRLRQRRPRLHRWLGRIYLGAGALVGGLSGLYLAQFAFGGTAARVGFGVLAVLWLYTGLRAYVAVRRGKVTEHRRWMIRNFALTFAAVMLRVYVPLSVAAGAGFAEVYPVIAWVCWVPNLLFAEWMWNRNGLTVAARS